MRLDLSRFCAAPASTDIAAIAALPAAAFTAYLTVFTSSLHPMYLFAAVGAVIGFFLALRIEDIELRDNVVPVATLVT